MGEPATQDKGNAGTGSNREGSEETGMLTEASAAPTGQVSQGVTSPRAQRDVELESFCTLSLRWDIAEKLWLSMRNLPHGEVVGNMTTTGLASWQMAADKGA